jgi:hypothetical protein
MPCQSYDQEAVRQKIQHAVSILVETEAVRKVGGFDEELATWEDWDFFIKLAAHGYCGVRVSEPLLVYQTETGTRRLKAFEPGSTIYQQIVDKWKDVNFMPCCGQSAKIERRPLTPWLTRRSPVTFLTAGSGSSMLARLRPASRCWASTRWRTTASTIRLMRCRRKSTSFCSSAPSSRLNLVD